MTIPTQAEALKALAIVYYSLGKRSSDAEATLRAFIQAHPDAAPAGAREPEGASKFHPNDLEWLERQQHVADDGSRILYETDDVDEVAHALTGDEGEDDSITVLRRLAAYVESVWPGKTALQVLIEHEEAPQDTQGKDTA